MKAASDPRHVRREKAIKTLYSWGFLKEKRRINNLLAQKVIASKEKIDKIISCCAPEWPISQINRIDLAILRLAVFELVIDSREPPKVVIDEAIELAKKYGSEKSGSFVNGVLGSVLKEKNKLPRTKSPRHSPLT